MKVESMQSPVAKFEITLIDKDFVEVDFFTNIQKKQRKSNENSDTVVEYYEYDNYKIKIRNRFNLESQIDTHYDEWLQYAISKDDREHIPTEYEVVKMQYDEYEPLDRPSFLKEMRDIDPALEEELINLLIESRKLMETLSAEQPVARNLKLSSRTIIVSDKLKQFKDKKKKYI